MVTCDNACRVRKIYFSNCFNHVDINFCLCVWSNLLGFILATVWGRCLIIVMLSLSFLPLCYWTFVGKWVCNILFVQTILNTSNASWFVRTRWNCRDCYKVTATKYALLLWTMVDFVYSALTDINCFWTPWTFPQLNLSCIYSNCHELFPTAMNYCRLLIFPDGTDSYFCMMITWE